jgi:hypothetical protein
MIAHYGEYIYMVTIVALGFGIAVWARRDQRKTNAKRRHPFLIEGMGQPPGVADIEVKFPRARGLGRPAKFQDDGTG